MYDGKSALEWAPLAGRSLLQRFNLASGAVTPLATAPGSAAVSDPPLVPGARKAAADLGGNIDRPLAAALERVVVAEEDQVAATAQRSPAWRRPSKALTQTSKLDEEPRVAGRMLLTQQAGAAARSTPRQEAVQHGLAEAVNASMFSLAGGIWAHLPGNLSESGGAAGFPLSEPSSPGSRPMHVAFYEWLLVLVRGTSAYCWGLALKGSESAWQSGRLLTEQMPGVNLKQAKLSLARLRAGGADGTTMAVVTVVAVGVLLFGVLWACSGSSEALSGRPRERHATQRQTRVRHLTLGAPQPPSPHESVSPKGLADAMTPLSSTSPRPKEWGEWGNSRRTTYKPTLSTEQLG